MFKEGPLYQDSPVKPCGEAWLVNAQQQKVVQFTPDASTVHAEWVRSGPTAGFCPAHLSR